MYLFCCGLGKDCDDLHNITHSKLLDYHYQIMDSSTLTFGAELEFALAWSRTLDPDDDCETFFEYTDRMNDYWDSTGCFDFAGSPEGFDMNYAYNEVVSKWAMFDDIVATLTEAGIDAYTNPFDGLDLPAQDITRWFVEDDFTVCGPRHSKYEWHSFDIVSPRYAFTEENVRVVKKVCDLVKNKYRTYNDATSGLHIHIGNGEIGFELPVLKKFISIIWAFEPQLDTIHPPYRRNSKYGKSMRDGCRMSCNWLDAYGIKPTALEGLAMINMKTDIPSLITLVSSEYHCKSGVYNLGGLRNLARGSALGATKPTIEFRQHKGTLGSEEVEMWLRTVMGIVIYAHNVHPTDLAALLDVTKQETWQRTGDRRDEEREAEMGPTLAEKGFTVTNLFRQIDLEQSATYYSEDKLYRQNGDLKGLLSHCVNFIDGTISKRQDLVPFHTTWEYETTLDPNSEAYKTAHAMRKRWETLRKYEIVSEEIRGEKVDHDLHSDKWPKHTTKVEGYTPDELKDDLC